MHDVLTIGTATQDVFLSSDEFKHVKNPEHLKKLGFKTGEAECFAVGSKMELKDLCLTYGGGATNAAVTFARQGLKTASLIRVGEDDIGKRIIENLKQEKVIPIVIKDKTRKTAYSTILLTSGGERTVLVYRGASEGLTKNEIPASRLKARWVYISPGNIAHTTIAQFVKQLKQGGAMVAMNPSRRYIELGTKRLAPLLRDLDVVILNREEASHLTGIAYDDEHAIFRAFDKVIDGIAVMTEGVKGALVSDGRYLYRAGVYKSKGVVDRTGAGDAFGSGCVAGLMYRNDVAFALKLASANATSVVESVGAQEGIIGKTALRKKRFKYLDLDIEPLL